MTDVLHPREACPIAEPRTQYLYLTGNWYDSTSSKVTKYGLGGFREELPPLNKGRWDHGCSGYYNEDNKFVLLVTGGFVKNPGGIFSKPILRFYCSNDTDRERTSSTEIFKVGVSTRWLEVSPLPSTLASPMAVSLDNNIYLLGVRKTKKGSFFVNILIIYRRTEFQHTQPNTSL